MTSAPDVRTLALGLYEDEAAEILTWADEPELLADPGQPIPVFPPDVIEAARLRSVWAMAGYLAEGVLQ